MKKNNELTITIGIPAFNEESNIGKLLVSLLSQKFPKNLKLKSIKVISDGSTDKTGEIVRLFRDKRIKLSDSLKRMGKNYRLNQLFKNLDTEVLVLFDADTLIHDENTVAVLVKEFLNYKGLGLVAGNAQPLKAKTLVESGVNNFVYSLNSMKSKINNGDNVYSVRGPIVAVSKEFASKVILPLNVPDDRYLYLQCIRLNYGFKYCDRAKVYFRSPQTINDQINQGFRFLKDKENLFKHFDAKFIEEQYSVPFGLKVLVFSRQIIKNPLAYLVMKYIQLQTIKRSGNKQEFKWKTVTSTKELN